MNDIDLNLDDLVTFAQRWASLGDTITDQVAQLLSDPGCGSCFDDGTEHGVNPAAIARARDGLKGLSENLDDALDAFLTQHPA